MDIVAQINNGVYTSNLPKGNKDARAAQAKDQLARDEMFREDMHRYFHTGDDSHGDEMDKAFEAGRNFGAMEIFIIFSDLVSGEGDSVMAMMLSEDASSFSYF